MKNISVYFAVIDIVHCAYKNYMKYFDKQIIDTLYIVFIILCYIIVQLKKIN